MSKRYLGGGVSFEQKEVYQEFSEEESGGSSTLAGLSDVDISEPANGESLVYNDETEKWENKALSMYDIVLELVLEEGDVTSVTEIYMNENAVVQKAQQGKIVTSFVYVVDEYNNLKTFNGWGSGVSYEVEEQGQGAIHSLSVYAARYGFTQPTYLVYDFEAHEWLLD